MHVSYTRDLGSEYSNLFWKMYYKNLLNSFRKNSIVSFADLMTDLVFPPPLVIILKLKIFGLLAYGFASGRLTNTSTFGCKEH